MAAGLLELQHKIEEEGNGARKSAEDWKQTLRKRQTDSRKLEAILSSPPQCVSSVNHLFPVAELAVGGNEDGPIKAWGITLCKACINHRAKTLEGCVLRHEAIGEQVDIRNDADAI